jgi:hypothetical protein
LHGALGRTLANRTGCSFYVSATADKSLLMNAADDGDPIMLTALSIDWAGINSCVTELLGATALAGRMIDVALCGHLAQLRI